MAIDDVVGALSVPGRIVTSYELIDNPGGFFKISGSNLVQAVDTPEGIYSATVKGNGVGFSATKSFSLDFVPVPLGEFFFGLNLSGAENEFPVFPTFAQFKYWTDRGVQYFRIPFCWSKFNSINNSTVGIQHAAFGDLDTTSTGLPLTGVNRIYNSDQPSTWRTFAAAGTISATNNVGIGPNGFPAHLLTANRPTGTDYAVFVLPDTSLGTTTQITGGFWFKANNPSDVGKVFDIEFSAPGGNPRYGQTPITLTADWVLYTVTVTAPNGTELNVEPFAGSASPGSIGILMSEAQVNLGPTRVPYVPTIAGYVQAMDQLMVDAASTGAKLLLDCHMFGAGPEGDLGAGTPPAALADMWDKITQRWGANPVVWGMEFMNEPGNGFDVSIVIDYSQLCVTAVRDRGFTGKLGVDGVNFTGVWNWVSGQGQPFNNSGLYVISDPLNNLMPNGHGYFDRNSSGGFFAWQVETVTPGQAPPPISTSHDIGTLRLGREWLPWLVQHDLDGCYSEFGVSVDPILQGGANNWRDWIITGRNAIDLCKANDIPCFLWGAGFGFGASYGFNPEPYSAVTGAKVFDGTGVDSVLVAGLINHYVTNPQSQPTAYLLVPPQTITSSGDPTAPIVTTDTYGTIGTPTNPLTIIYGGIVPPGVVITPEAFLSDNVTPAGGAFTPATVPLTPGENALAEFTYTPAITDTILIRTTNNQGWADPPAVAISTQADAWRDTGLSPAPLYALYRSLTPHIGAALQILSPATSAVQDWSFTRGNDLDRVAIQAWAGRQDLIPVLIKYDQSIAGIDETVSGATLNLQNTDPTSANFGYPEIVYTAMNGTAAVQVSRTGAMTVVARMKQAGTSGNAPYISTFLFSSGAPFSLGPDVSGTIPGDIFQIENTGFVGSTSISGNAIVGSVGLGVTNGQFHNYTVTYQQGLSTGLISYLDGTQHATASLTSTVTSQFTLSQTSHVATITNLIGVLHAGDVATGSGVPANNAFVSDNGDGTWQMSQSGTVAAVACKGFGIWYGLNTGFDNSGAQFGFVSFGSSGWQGSDTLTAFLPGVAASPAQITTILSYETAHYSTPLPDVLPPIFLGVTNQNASSGVSATPFGSITLQDAAGTSVSITFTLTGHTAAMAGTGLTGSGPYILTADTVANINTKLHALTFTSTGSPGDDTHIAMVATSSTTLTAPAAMDVVLFAASPPVISSMVGPNVSMDQGAPALWQVVVSDPNPSPTVSASIAISGGPGTISHLGPYTPSGTGPYTFPLMTPIELQRALRNLLWLPSVTTVGTTTTFTVTITNNLGLTASSSNTITNVAVAVLPAALTPVATPGTLPHHYKGINLAGGQFGSPANGDNGLYVTDDSYYTFFDTGPGAGMKTVRLPVLFGYLFRTATIVFGSRLGQIYQGYSAGDIAALQTCVERARAHGMYIQIDDHSFGGFINQWPVGTADEPNSQGTDWGKDIRTPTSGYADLWARVFSLFQNFPNIVIGNMNEPNWTEAYFITATKAIRDAIRPIGTFGATVPIMSPAYANTVGSSVNVALWAANYTDTGPFSLQVHQYFDGSGGNQNTCENNNPAHFFDTFTNNCRTFGFTAQVTEFAYGTDISCNQVDPGVPNYFTTNADVYIGWTWWWSGRISPTTLYYLGPSGANAQLSSLTSNLGNTF